MHHAGRSLTYFNAVLPLWFDLATKSMHLWRDARRIGASLRRRDLRNLQDVARAFAHLDRVADAALRAFKNLSRHDVADRVLAPPEAQLLAHVLERRRHQLDTVGVKRRVPKQMIDPHVLSPVSKRSNDAVALHGCLRRRPPCSGCAKFVIGEHTLPGALTVRGGQRLMLGSRSRIARGDRV